MRQAGKDDPLDIGQDLVHRMADRRRIRVELLRDVSGRDPGQDRVLLDAAPVVGRPVANRSEQLAQLAVVDFRRRSVFDWVLEDGKRFDRDGRKLSHARHI